MGQRKLKLKISFWKVWLVSFDGKINFTIWNAICRIFEVTKQWFFNDLLLIFMVSKQILGPPVAMATVTKVKKKSHIFVSVP